ncbi:amiloride-sensitive amine oxidase [copper-containing]-like [Haliotis rubra]|uniref:amiloride-sensitive amine oxidase [copper-containing]-like n=1 Tax=Haliotis rubra TaxID=36100 RepID=UPI001EE54159|nr:amiloride-sensitive amine oxidase [copper-containing]-like [Haliotis rubra]
MPVNGSFTPDSAIEMKDTAYLSHSNPELHMSNNSLQRNERRGSTCQTLCTQVFAIIVFITGLGIGIVIGYFALNPRQADCNAPSVQGRPSELMVTPAFTSATGSPPAVPFTTPPPHLTPKCPTGNMITKTDKSEDKGLFELLTTEEMEQVRNFLKREGLISSIDGTPSLRDSYIYGMSLYLPQKSAALKHLDKGERSPGRFADVHVHRGNRNSPDLMEYRVGPLGESMTAQAMYTDGELPYNSRPRDGIEWDGLTEQVTRAMAILRPLLQESFDGAYYPNGGLTFHPQAPPGLQPDERETRFVMALHVEGTARGRDLHPLPLTGTVHNPGVDTRKWYTHSFYYLNQGPFASAEELLSAYSNGTVRKFSFSKGYRQTIFATSFPKQNSDKRRQYASTKSPPRSYTPSGHRFVINDHNIKWMGWDFTVGASQFRGPSIFNVKFKDERIVYENSLNDVVLVYASDVSSGANTIYMDATFGVGEFQNVIRGVDCPDHAAILGATWFNSYSQSPVSAKTICVFETAGEQALWRRKDKYAAGLANNHLIVRIPMSVGNYDYTIDFMFHLDGTLKTEAVASGYLQASFWDPENPHAGTEKSTDPFGFRLGEYTHGALHDHTFGFKVDLDILGTDNSFEVIHWKAGDVLKALKTQSNIATKPSYFLYNETRYIEWETLQKESGLKIDMSRPQFWTVVNENQKNRWGAKRGYRIVPETSEAQVVPESHPVMEAVSYTKYHCMVTQQKDDEKYITGRTISTAWLTRWCQWTK